MSSDQLPSKKEELRKKRADWRAEAFQELQGTQADVAFVAIEGEDFEGQNKERGPA